MITKLEAWFRRIIASEVATLTKEQRDIAVSLSNDINASLRVLHDFRIEALELLATIEKSQPSCCAEKQKLIVEFRDKFADFRQKFEQLHPTAK